MPRFNSRQSLGACPHVSNKERPDAALSPSLVNRCEPLSGIGNHDIVYINPDTAAK